MNGWLIKDWKDYDEKSRGHQKYMDQKYMDIDEPTDSSCFKTIFEKLSAICGGHDSIIVLKSDNLGRPDNEFENNFLAAGYSEEYCYKY